MRKSLFALMMILILPLSACGGGDSGNEAEEAMTRIREQYLDLAACSGQGAITADYGQRVYRYEVDFTWQAEGETRLTLTAPENVAGTTARIAGGETALEYDGVMVETGELSSTGLTPIDALPALLSCAREGFLAECVLEDPEGDRQLRVICRDPEQEPGQGVETQLWFDLDNAALLRGEISEGGVTVIQCEFSAFAMEFSSQ